MRIVEFDQVQDFLAATQSSLEEHETENNLILGIAFVLRDDPSRYPQKPFLACVYDEQEEPILNCLMTPPYPLLVQSETVIPSAIDLLQRFLLDKEISITGVNGRQDTSDMFAQHWGRLAGQEPQLDMRLRAYELRQVIMPAMPEGNFRCLAAEHSETVIDFFKAFHDEAMGEGEEMTPIPVILKALESNKVYGWVKEGKVVSMALKGRPISHGQTVSAVYTPPEERRKGFASATVACLSQVILDEGCQFVNLFTDLSNPTSNAIYQAIGYRALCDFHKYYFV